MLASDAGDEVRIWDVEHLRGLAVVREPAPRKTRFVGWVGATHVSVSSRGEGRDAGSAAALVDLNGSEPARRVETGPFGVEAVLPSEPARYVALSNDWGGGPEDHVRIADAAMKPLTILQDDAGRAPLNVRWHFSADGAVAVATQSSQSDVLVWDLSKAAGTLRARRLTMPNAPDIRASTGDPTALSADGGTLVVIGHAEEKSRVFVVDLRGRAPVRTVELHGVRRPMASYDDVAVSPDGATLAVGTTDAVRGVDLASGRILWQRRTTDAGPYACADCDPMAGRGFRGLAFVRGARWIATGTWRGTALLLDAATGAPVGELGEPLRAALRVAFADDGTLATASGDRIVTWSLAEARLDRSAHVADLGALANDAAGRLLVVAHDGAVRPWPAGEGTPATSRIADELRLPLWGPRDGSLSTYGALSRDGKAVATVDLGALGVFDAATGKSIATARAPNDDEPRGIAFSDDGARVAVAGAKRLTIRAAASLAVEQTVDLPAPATAVAWGGARIAVGLADGTVAVVEGGRIAGSTPTAGGAVRDVAVDAKRGRIAATSADGLVRVIGAAQPAVLATLVDYEDGEWLVTTPRGAYAGTFEVGARIGWVFARPLEQHRYEQFEAAFRRPDLVARRLASGDASVDVEAEIARPPAVALAQAAPARASGESVDLVARASSATRVEVVRAFVEGRLVAEAPVCSAAGEARLTVPLLPGKNRVTLIAFDPRGVASNPAVADVVRDGGSARPDVWVVAIGIDRYPSLPASMSLGAAKNDARAVAAAFSAQAGKAFGAVHAKTLLDEQATPASIRGALRELAGMAPGDLAVVFFAGHGLQRKDTGDTVLATGGLAMRPDGKAFSPESLAGATIGWADLGAELERSRGRVLVMLDACHSGHVSRELVVPNDELAARLEREGRAGVAVLAAAKGRQLSYEPGMDRGLLLELDASAAGRTRFDAADPHGLFTGAVLSTLGDPVADADGDGALQLSELVESVRRRVSDASGGAQTPWLARRDLFGDFAVSAAAARPTAAASGPVAGGRCGCKVDDAACNTACDAAERQVTSALGDASGRAQRCRMIPGPRVPLKVEALVAPPGVLESLTVRGPTARDPHVPCVEKALRGAKLPRFTGTPVRAAFDLWIGVVTRCGSCASGDVECTLRCVPEND